MSSKVWTLAVAAMGVAVLLSGCSSGAADDSSAAIAMPTPPTARECKARLAKATPETGRPREATHAHPPPPGAYGYSMKGTRAIPGSGVRVKDLPTQGEQIITSPIEVGGSKCFKIQQRIAPDIANTSTYLIRQGDVFLVRLLIQAAGEAQDIRPAPPVLSASSAGTTWSGQFGGPTYGSYRFSVLGKRDFRIGHRHVSATGIASSVSYAGRVSGQQRSTAWIGQSPRLVVAESFRSSQRFAVSALKVALESKLVALRPRRATGS